MTAPDRFSWTQLSTYDGCGEAYRLKYVERVKPTIPQGALLGGISVHEAIRAGEPEEWWRWFPPPKHPQIDQHPLLATFRAELVQRVVDAGGSDAVRWTRQDGLWWFYHGGPSMMRRYAFVRQTDERHGVRVFNQDGDTNAGVEIEVTFVLPSGKQVTGRIDVFLVSSPVGPLIRDYSTGKPGGKNPIQMALYRRALQEGPGIDARYGEAVYLRSTENATLREVIDLDPYMPLVDRKFDSFERGIQHDVYPLREGWMCKGCQVRLHCPFGLTLGFDDLPPDTIFPHGVGPSGASPSSPQTSHLTGRSRGPEEPHPVAPLPGSQP